MDYYARKKKFKKALGEFLHEEINVNRIIPIAKLEIAYGLRFGFDKKIIKEALRPYEQIGFLEMDENTIIIRRKTISENKPAENTT